jgi:hypothetical protein
MCKLALLLSSIAKIDGAETREENPRMLLDRALRYFPRLGERRKQPGGDASDGEQQMLAATARLMQRTTVGATNADKCKRLKQRSNYFLNLPPSITSKTEGSGLPCLGGMFGGGLVGRRAQIPRRALRTL